MSATAQTVQESQARVKRSRPIAVYEAQSHGIAGWLVIDRSVDGLSFGGCRFAPGVTREEVTDLAHTMSWKLAAHGLPVGGAKAGLRCAPDHPDLPEALAEIANQWRTPLTQDVIIGKDMGASDALLNGLYEAIGVPQLHLSQMRNRQCPARISELGGYVRHMTGRGAAWAAEAAEGTLDGKRLIIQGSGVVGIGTAIRASQMGALVVGISDQFGAVASSEGLPAAALESIASANTRHLDYKSLISSSIERIDRDRLIGLEADILVLAAGSRTVTAQLAETIQAPLVVEASNFGLTDEANDVLHRKGITVIPDVIASSSSAAMVAHQMSTGNQWLAEPLWERISSSIRDAVRVTVEDGRKQAIPVRRAYMNHFAHVLG